MIETEDEIWKDSLAVTPGSLSKDQRTDTIVSTIVTMAMTIHASNQTRIGMTSFLLCAEFRHSLDAFVLECWHSSENMFTIPHSSSDETMHEPPVVLFQPWIHSLKAKSSFTMSFSFLICPRSYADPPHSSTP